MKILVFAAYFYPHRGGYEKYILELHKRLVKKGVVVDVITCNTNNALKEEVFEGLHIFRLDCWDILGGTYPIPKINKNFFYILKKLNNKKYDFVNTQTRFFLTSFLGFIFAKLNKIKLIHTEHGAQHTILPHILTSLVSRLYDHTLGYLVIRGADYHISISKASGEFSKHLGAKDYTIIYNGVDAEKFKRRSTDLKERLRIGKDYKVITFVGRLIEAKGVQDLIEAFHQVKNLIHNIKLLIVGEGNFKFELQKLAHHDRDIIFLGERNTDELVEILSITDLFINPSYSEGLPTSMLEALACGCDVVATDVGGTREIYDHLINTRKRFYLYNPVDVNELIKKIVLVLNEITKVSGNPFKNDEIQFFSWNTISIKYLHLINGFCLKQ